MPIQVSPLRCGTRKVGKNTSGNRADRRSNDAEDGTTARNEMDSMADTSCAGSNWRLLEDTGLTCDVYPFKEGYAAVKDVPIATCATLVEGEDGSDFILIGHEMLYFGREMQRSLLNQNQIRAHIRHDRGFVQDDYTRVDEAFGITTKEMFIPFCMDGSAVYFESRAPSIHEVETLPHIVITSKERWDPHVRPLRAAYTQVTPAKPRRINHVVDRDRDWWDMSPILNENVFRTQVINSVNIREWYDENEYLSPNVPNSEPSRDLRPTYVGALVAQHRHTPITAENLSRMWNVGLDTARRTLRATTQNGVRTAIHPITRRYRTDHLHLHRRRLNTTFYTDTLFSRIKSLRGNNCAQVFTNGRYTAVYPMTTKAHAGDALRQLSSDVGIPDTLVADLAGEHTGHDTEFSKQIRRLDIRIHYTEKGRKNQNHRAEREIGILKTRWKHRMTSQCVPTRLWDYGW